MLIYFMYILKIIGLVWALIGASITVLNWRMSLDPHPGEKHHVSKIVLGIVASVLLSPILAVGMLVVLVLESLTDHPEPLEL